MPCTSNTERNRGHQWGLVAPLLQGPQFAQRPVFHRLTPQSAVLHRSWRRKILSRKILSPHSILGATRYTVRDCIHEVISRRPVPNTSGSYRNPKRARHYYDMNEGSTLHDWRQKWSSYRNVLNPAHTHLMDIPDSGSTWSINTEGARSS